MSLSYFRVFFIISLILLPLASRGDNDVPTNLAPFFAHTHTRTDDLCKEVECGKGSCETAIGSPFNFKCKCNNGWKRTRINDDEQDLEFLPCIIPDCEVDYSCMPAAPPLPATPHNISFFDQLAIGSTVEKARAQKTQHAPTRVNAILATPISSISLPFLAIVIVLLDRTRVKGLCSNHPLLLQIHLQIMVTPTKAVAFILGKFNWIAVLFATAAVAFWK
ncbi:hypothetical protein OROHE_003930 [Orobanche hederae]